MIAIYKINAFYTACSCLYAFICLGVFVSLKLFMAVKQIDKTLIQHDVINLNFKTITAQHLIASSDISSCLKLLAELLKASPDNCVSSFK